MLHVGSDRARPRFFEVEMARFPVMASVDSLVAQPLSRFRRILSLQNKKKSPYRRQAFVGRIVNNEIQHSFLTKQKKSPYRRQAFVGRIVNNEIQYQRIALYLLILKSIDVPSWRR